MQKMAAKMGVAGGWQVFHMGFLGVLSGFCAVGLCVCKCIERWLLTGPSQQQLFDFLVPIEMACIH